MIVSRVGKAETREVTCCQHWTEKICIHSSAVDRKIPEAVSYWLDTEKPVEISVAFVWARGGQWRLVASQVPVLIYSALHYFYVWLVQSRHAESNAVLSERTRPGRVIWPTSCSLLPPEWCAPACALSLRQTVTPHLGCTPSSESGLFLFSGPASWNSLPAELRTISDTSVLKNKLKTYFFGLAFDIQ